MSKKGEERERQRRIKVLERARKKAAPKPGPSKAGEKVGLVKRITEFFKDVRREYKKVSWPPRKEAVSSTWVVVSVVFIFGFYFFIVDHIIGFFVKKLITFGLQ